ncbi:MAG: ATP-binding protein [Nannocystis sp.]|nr:AAA family ATPase [Nannocystis sp.]MBA3549396.1 ATP-binding protein [Nannocystis sp.]
MSLNWRALAPHRPLAPGETGYVAPPSGFAERIARQVAAGTSTVLVTGPVGVGKSTELAHAATLLHGTTHFACLVQIDRKENLRQLTAEQTLLRIAGSLGESIGPNVSRDLRASLVEAGVIDQSFKSAAAAASLKAMFPNAIPAPFRGSGRSLARAAIGEVARLAPEGRVALLLDGLEKLPEGPKAMEVLAALAELGDEVDLVVVVPWFAAFGNSDEVIRPGAHIVPVPACEVEGDPGEPGRRFLLDILAHRLGLPSEYFDPGTIVGTISTDIERAREDVTQRRALILDAARWSGGLPRTFLQLIADAAQYAQIRRGDEWPQMQDLADAVADQTDSYRRALLPGDTKAIHQVLGSDGREMALDRKIRLLARGIILERARGSAWSIDVHPLVRPLLGLAGHA